MSNHAIFLYTERLCIQLSSCKICNSNMELFLHKKNIVWNLIVYALTKVYTESIHS